MSATAKKLDDTGERMIPETHKGHSIYGEHIARYKAGASLVKNKVVLDIASGTGYGTAIMAVTAKKVYGVDVSEEAIEYSQTHYSASNIEYRVGDGESIPLGNNSIDVVVSYETIEHIKDYDQFMREVKRVLKEDGVLLLSTPNDIEYIEGNHYHLHEFTYNELTKLVNRYYKNRKDYFQTLWTYNTVLPADLQTTEWERDILTLNTISLKKEDCIYFFMLCSDRKINESLDPIGAIGEHFRLKEIQSSQDASAKMQNELTKQYKRVGELHADLVNKNEQLEAAKEELNDIKSSLIRRSIAFSKKRILRRVRKLKRDRNNLQ